MSPPPSTTRAVQLSAAVSTLVHIPAPVASLTGIRVENVIGFAKIPIGLAGPQTIHGTHQRGPTVFAPFATVEPTLVAACSRGCKAFQTAAGGIHVEALREGMSRAPAFRFSNVAAAVAFHKRVPSLEAQFRADAESTSRFAKLITVSSSIIGSTVHVRFTYACGDAAGQNMATLATHAACTAFLASEDAKEAGIVGFMIEGQMASDKKASWGNVFSPRGVEVVAWGTLTPDACRKVRYTVAKVEDFDGCH